MASLVVVAKINAYRAQDAIDQLIDAPLEYIVTISGAVKKPGEYPCSAGTSIGDALKKAKPSPFANLQLLDLKKFITGPCDVVIEELKEVRVQVDGAILEPLEIVMPVGSRISDLKSKIDFTQESDKSFFRRKKLLKDGDKITVPKKGLERK